MNSFRVGQGWDRHRLVKGRALVLGGVALDSELGCLGHSDGDPLAHALTDAILGAIGQGDIGRHFPPSDDRWRGSPSSVFLEHAVGLARAAGWDLVNADATVVLEKPKLAAHIDAIRASLAAMLGVDQALVSVKAKTAEGLDACGRLEAVEAQAVVLLAGSR